MANEPMEEEQFRRLLQAYLDGRLDEVARRKIDEWFDSFGYDPSSIELLREHKAQRIQQALETRLLNYIHASVRPRQRRIWRYVAAASILLAAALGWWATDKLTRSTFISGQTRISYDTLTAPVGKMTKAVLPDRSVVWLNANTQIRYEHTNFSVKREVIIDYGEAFFKVTENPAKPFVVHAGDLNTTVLGTAFNVKYYTRLAFVDVQVKSGKVAVSTDDERLLDTLLAGNGIRYDIAKGVLGEADLFAEDAGSWKDGRILLEDATFDELAMVIYNRFRVRLRTELPEADGFRYTMTILPDKSLKEIMQLICNVHQTNYRRKGHEITIY